MRLFKKKEKIYCIDCEHIIGSYPYTKEHTFCNIYVVDTPIQQERDWCHFVNENNDCKNFELKRKK
jgi:hypothetical protein